MLKPIKIGISSCLLGNNVRWNGGHKKDRFLVHTLGQFVTWVPVCPEVECGLGTPRETLRQVGDPIQFGRLIDLGHNRQSFRRGGGGIG